MICFELNWLFYDPSHILKLSEFVWTLSSSVKSFLTIFSLKSVDSTDRSKISSDLKRLFFAVSHLLFFANTPF